MENITKLIESIQPYIGILLTLLMGIVSMQAIFSGLEVNIFTVLSFIGALIFICDTCKLWLNTRKNN